LLYIIIGESLIVSYAEREHNIRLISAREATKRERENYEKG